MYSQVWIGVTIQMVLITIVTSDWVQLPMVEPGNGKIKLRVQARDQDDQIESPEEDARKDTNHDDLIAEPTSVHNLPINQGTINKISKHKIADDELGNHKVQFIQKDPSHESKELLETSDSGDSVSFVPSQNHFGSATITTIQPTKWPYESILETEVNTVFMPDFHLHLSTNFNSPENSQTQPIKQSGVELSETNGFNDGVDISTPFPETQYSSKETWSKNSSSAEDSNSQEVPFDMLKSVHQTLLQETPRTVQGKMEYLQQLSNRMLSYMEKYIKRLWISDVDRQSRTDKGMGFPSSEGALMTLSFLIFAVFLIKLVKQLCQALQEKNMAMSMMTTRHTRSLPDLLNTARVLQLIDDFPILEADPA